MRKEYFFILGFVLVALVGGFFFMRQGDNSGIDIPNLNQNLPVDSGEGEVGKVQNAQVGGVPSSLDLWNIFSRYLKAAQDHDRDALKTFAFALSPACVGSPVSKDCIQRMDAVYEAGKNLSQKEFTSLWADERQAILMTTPKETEDSQSIGFSRAVIFFAKNKDGKFGLLALDPKRIWLVKKNATTSREMLLENAKKDMTDSDQDGITDNFENCIFPDNLIVLSECTKTNPNLRDTNNDLWWDGIGTYTKLFE